MIDMIRTKILIIGGGVAACRSALEASKSCTDILMVLKGTIGKSGSSTINASEMAGFNVPNGSVDKTDNPENYYNDIIEAGAGMAIPKLARTVAERAYDEFKLLCSLNVPFERSEDSFYAFKSCFSNKPRTHVIKGHALPIIQALYKEIKKNKCIKILQNTTVIKILVKDAACYGAVIVTENKEVKVVLTHSIVLGTGGGVQIFENNLNPKDITGDGYILGYEAGAKLMNMEFMQAGVGFVKPNRSLFPAYLWSGIPDIVNRYGNHFIGKGTGYTEREILLEHAGHFPFSSKDKSRFVEIKIQEEIENGKGTDRSGVYINFHKFSDEYIMNLDDEYGIRKMWYIQKEYLESQKVDVQRDQLEISCFAHAINGGLLINECAMTNINGLFAAGEAAGGPHGADRLGGNMIVTCLIFGKIAGKNAAEYAKEIKNGFDEIDNHTLDECYDILYRDIDVDLMKSELKKSTQSNLLVRRTQAGLTNLMDLTISLEKEIWSSKKTNRMNLKNIELKNMILLANLMSQAAFNRKESRGSHYRIDFPEKNDEQFLKIQSIDKKNGFCFE